MHNFKRLLEKHFGQLPMIDNTKFEREELEAKKKESLDISKDNRTKKKKKHG